MEASEFREKVLPVSRRLYRYAERLLGNAHDAEDVVQDIWMKLWDRRESLSEVKSIEAFAYRMTRNLCLDRLKLKKPHYYDDRAETAYAFDRADGTPGPEKTLEMKETMDRLNRMMGKLPEKQQTLLHLREIEGLEYEEIAGITGMEINAIRVNISRARKILRKALQKVNRA